MDEPSNFLDLPAMEALEHLMKSYEGTIVFISHDARLIENVADQVYAIEHKQIIRIR
jgi:macrolide transport system ATP-binding/permease protein